MLEATKRVLLRDGYDDAKVTDVAEVAGVSPGSLYQYFPSLESLVVALHVSLAEAEVAYLADNLMEARDDEPRDVAAIIALVSIRVRADDADLYRALLEVAPRIGAARKLAPVHDEMRALLAGFLRSRREVTAPDPDVAARIVCTSLRATIESTLQHAPDTLATDTFAEEMRALVHGYLWRT